MVSLFWLRGSLVLIAAIDVSIQLWTWKRKLRMALQEIRDEMRDAEGKPEVKSRIRMLQMEMSKRRMMEDAPKVVAKGADLMAAQIRNIAVGAHVPLIAAPQLARALYAHAPLGQEIPADHYLEPIKLTALMARFQLATYTHPSQTRVSQRVGTPRKRKRPTP